jgi:hypothetical protein
MNGTRRIGLMSAQPDGSILQSSAVRPATTDPNATDLEVAPDGGTPTGAASATLPSRTLSQHLSEPFLPKVVVGGEGFGDFALRHQHETHGVAQRLRLVWPCMQ